VHVIAVPYTAFLARELVARAPSPLTAYASICECIFTILKYSMSAYYHAVHHEPGRRAYLRGWDHASIFLGIAGIYAPILAVSWERTRDDRVMYISYAMGSITVLGASLSALQLSVKLSKLWRTLMFVAVGWVGSFAFLISSFTDPRVYAYFILGGIAYTLGGLGYSKHWPNPVPGVFGYHEVFHVATVLAHTCMSLGTMCAFAD